MNPSKPTTVWCVVLIILTSCSTRETIRFVIKTPDGCFYKTSPNNLQFLDKECRYNIGDEITPYFQRSTYKSKHSH